VVRRKDRDHKQKSLWHSLKRLVFRSSIQGEAEVHTGTFVGEKKKGKKGGGLGGGG